MTDVPRNEETEEKAPLKHYVLNAESGHHDTLTGAWMSDVWVTRNPPPEEKDE